MHIQPIKLPTLTLPEPCNYNPSAALVIRAGLTAKFQRENRASQDKAALTPAVSPTHEDATSVNAINCAVNGILQAPSI